MRSVSPDRGDLVLEGGDDDYEYSRTVAAEHSRARPADRHAAGRTPDSRLHANATYALLPQSHTIYWGRTIKEAVRIATRTQVSFAPVDWVIVAVSEPGVAGHDLTATVHAGGGRIRGRAGVAAGAAVVLVDQHVCLASIADDSVAVREPLIASHDLAITVHARSGRIRGRCAPPAAPATVVKVGLQVCLAPVAGIHVAVAEPGIAGSDLAAAVHANAGRILVRAGVAAGPAVARVVE